MLNNVDLKMHVVMKHDLFLNLAETQLYNAKQCRFNNACCYET